MIASLSMFGSSNSVNGSVVSMTIHTKHTHNKKDINQSRSSRQQQLIDIPCPPFSMSFSSSSELWLLRSAAIVSFVRSFVRVLDQILPIEGRLGGGEQIR